MKQAVYFIELGLVGFIASMIILTQFMEPVNALYFFPLVALPVFMGILSGTNIKFLLLPDKFQSVQNSRATARYKVNHFPGEITLPDGEIINILLNDVSSGGFQISCPGTTRQNLSEKISQLKKTKSKIELTADIPFNERIEKIKADCKIAYIAKRKRKKEILPFVAGLEVTEFKDNGNETIEKLMDKLAFAAA